ncbi:MAG: Y-family DNA polymerase, partial [Prevotellaceae bacterium]|nr:Y-family DNA polymerase [Prevotellaceae bacterium]
MYALVDCNSFFCSVEQAFHPGLRGKPVCVLSSNDGCIVALTPEAKALGLRRGDPLFKVQSIVRAHNVAVFSSNMTLYAAMSKRVTSILRHSIAHVENYSIDESFCDLRGYDRHHSLETMMRDIADRIL